MLALLGALAWMLMDPADRSRPRVLLFLAAIPVYGFCCSGLLNAENAWMPMKFDLRLFQIDRALGISAPALARALRAASLTGYLDGVYRLLLIAMAVSYGRRLRMGDEPSILRAFAAQLFLGPLLYALAPACGPVYALPGFPGKAEPTGFQAVALSCDPNAMPSLHMSTALLLVIFAGGSAWRLAAAGFALATALATITTGEHYIIDLVVALPFGCFAAAVAYSRWRLASLLLALVVAWLLGIRFTAPWMAGHPAVLWMCVASTVVATAGSALRLLRGTVPVRARARLEGSGVLAAVAQTR